MDPIQLVIIFVSIALTTLLLLLGVQVFLILKEVRRSIETINTVLSDIRHVSSQARQSVMSLSGFVGGMKAGMNIISHLKKKEGDGSG